MRMTCPLSRRCATDHSSSAELGLGGGNDRLTLKADIKTDIVLRPNEGLLEIFDCPSRVAPMVLHFLGTTGAEIRTTVQRDSTGLASQGKSYSLTWMVEAQGTTVKLHGYQEAHLSWTTPVDNQAGTVHL